MSSNSIYRGSSIDDFLIHYGLNAYSPTHYGHYFEKLFQTEFTVMKELTQFLGKCKFLERVYCINNHITERPKCKCGCGKPVTFSHKHVYHNYFDHNCAMRDMPNILGVENTSQLPGVTEKKRQTSLERFGVSWPTQTTDARAYNSECAKKRYDERKPDKFIQPMSKKQYYRCVKNLTEQAYYRNHDILDPENLRSREWHVDHMFSVSDGFRLGIDPLIIGDLCNLRMLDAFTNSVIKHTKSCISQEELIQRYNQRHDSA